MVNLVITVVFVAFIVGIWLLRNYSMSDEDSAKRENSKESGERPVVYITQDKLSQIDVKVNNEYVNVQKTTQQNNIYPDSDIETVAPPVSSSSSSEPATHDIHSVITDDNGNDTFEEKPEPVVIGDEVPTNDIIKDSNEQTSEIEDEQPVKKLDSSIDYASIADYFSGKLNDVAVNENETVVGDDVKNEQQTEIETIDNNNSEEKVIWSGDELDDEKNSRTIILADEMNAGDAYVYYRQNMNGETFKGIIIAEKRLEEDRKNNIVRARYARQAINSEYKKGFIMRSADIGSLKFYAATKAEIDDFLNNCQENEEDLAYVLGPYKDKYLKNT